MKISIQKESQPQHHLKAISSMITVYGASGHAKVVIDIITSNQYTITQVLDDNDAITSIMGYEVTKPLLKVYENVVIAIGNNTIRKKIAQQLQAKYSKALIHNTATIGSDVLLGAGTVVMPRAIINASVSIGSHCIVNSASVIEHDVTIGDFAHISPGAIVTGGVTIGDGCHVGAGAVILPNLTIGKNVIIGAGAVVINDIADYNVVVGNPARILKKNLENE